MATHGHELKPYLWVRRTQTWTENGFFFSSAWWNGRCASVKVKVRFVRAVLETVRRCTGMHICTALWLHLIRIKESCTHWTGEWIRWHIVTRAICYYGDVAGSTCSFLSFRHNFNLNFIWDFWLLTYFPDDHHSGWVHTFDLAQILCWVLSLTHLYSANSQQQSPQDASYCYIKTLQYSSRWIPGCNAPGSTLIIVVQKDLELNSSCLSS